MDAEGVENIVPQTFVLSLLFMRLKINQILTKHSNCVTTYYNHFERPVFFYQHVNMFAICKSHGLFFKLFVQIKWCDFNWKLVMAAS